MEKRANAFTNKTIVITGAGGVYGRAASLYFASSGANICMIDFNEKFLSSAVLEVQSISDKNKVLSFVCNMGNMEEVSKIVGEIEATFETIDFLVNNACYRGIFEETQNYSLDDLKKVFEINVYGSFHLLKACSKSMIKNKIKGAVVNVSSEASSGVRNMIAYSASKGAVLSMTKSASKDLAPYGIKVNCISPSLCSEDPEEISNRKIDEEQIMKAVNVKEVVSVIAFLLSDSSSYVIGQDVHIKNESIKLNPQKV